MFILTFGTRTDQYHLLYVHPIRSEIKSKASLSKERWWLAVKWKTRVSSHLGLTSWLYLNSRVDIHPENRTHYLSL